MTILIFFIICGLAVATGVMARYWGDKHKIFIYLFFTFMGLVALFILYNIPIAFANQIKEWFGK